MKKQHVFLLKIGASLMLIFALCYIYRLYRLSLQDDVVIQTRIGHITSDNHYCTDGKEDCEKNEQFFNGTWFYTGQDNVDQYMDLPIDPQDL